MAHGPSHGGGWHWRHAHKQRAPLEIVPVGTYSTGLGSTSAEIVAFDPQSDRLFVSNAVTSTIGLIPTPGLERKAAPLLAQAAAESASRGERRSGWPAKRRTKRAPGPTPAAWSSRPRPSPRDPTRASW